MTISWIRTLQRCLIFASVSALFVTGATVARGNTYVDALASFGLGTGIIGSCSDMHFAPSGTVGATCGPSTFGDFQNWIANGQAFSTANVGSLRTFASDDMILGGDGIHPVRGDSLVTATALTSDTLTLPTTQLTPVFTKPGPSRARPQAGPARSG